MRNENLLLRILWVRKTKLWSVYESELEANRGKIAAQSYGYEVE